MTVLDILQSVVDGMRDYVVAAEAATFRYQVSIVNFDQDAIKQF